MAAKDKVLFVGELDKSIPKYKEFSEKYDCIEYEITTKEKLLEDYKTKFQDVKAIYGAWQAFFLIGGFRGELIDQAPPNLKIISICSVGFDGFDGPAMRSKKDIILTNVPSDGAAAPVADLVLYLTLSSFRNFKVFEEAFHEKNHTILSRFAIQTDSFDSKIGKPVAVKDGGYAFGERFGGRNVLSPAAHNVLIVGFGNIGQTIGSRLSAIGMNIHYTKRTKLTEEQESKLGYKVTYHSSVLEAKDVIDLIVIACPATPETKHLINKHVIDSISKPFRIVNIGRGLVIDEPALVEGLESGKVLFAGLDVYEQEPKCHEGLIGRHDVILTPHIGASTKENFDHTATVALENLDNVLQGGKGITPVN